MARTRDLNTEEICCFANDLYHYLRHSFGFSSTHPCGEDSKFENEEPEEKNKSFFCKDIGEAVIISQYFLRKICRFFFNCIAQDLTYSQSFFNMCMTAFMRVWLNRRKNVFHQVVDAAAIIMEAILHCNLNSNPKFGESFGPSMFSLYFESQLKQEFFARGGWAEFKRVAKDDYSSFEYQLSHFLRKPHGFETSVNCSIVRTLKHGQVMFPVETSRICKACKDTLPDELHEFLCYASTFFKLKPFLGSDKILTEEEEMEKVNDFKRSESEANAEEITLDEPCEKFLCLFLGEKEIEVKKPEKKKNLIYLR